MNTKSILTRTAVLAGSAGLLASLGAVGASAASASTHRNQTLTATTKIVNRYDGGGNGYWAYDSFGRVLNLQYLGKVTPAMIAADPALASTPYMYTATLTDKGTFKDIPGAFTPNQGGRDAGRTLRPTQVKGTMSGYGDFAVFYASQKAAGYRGDAYTVPPALRGPAQEPALPVELLARAGVRQRHHVRWRERDRLQLHLHRHQDRSRQARPGADLGGQRLERRRPAPRRRQHHWLSSPIPDRSRATRRAARLCHVLSRAGS